MSRKDTILISVIVNTVLLAILFATAVIYDGEGESEGADFVTPVADHKASLSPPSIPGALVVAHPAEEDEVDHVLKYYVQPTGQPVGIDSRSEEVLPPEPIAVQTNASEEEWGSQEGVGGTSPKESLSLPLVEMTVKKGDVLEKIAKAHGTTVSAIKKANHLSSEKLSIGQVLKVPVKKTTAREKPAEKATAQASQGSAKTKQESRQESKQQAGGTGGAEGMEAVYYVIKNGDNPWKIAKQFNVNFEDILKLNQLDEERARNLKAGEKIRVK